MSKRDKLLAAMRANPRDWSLSDVESLCRQFDIACSAPQRGSHFKLYHPRIAGILTIPARKPIKPIYIRLLIDMVDEVESL